MNSDPLKDEPKKENQQEIAAKEPPKQPSRFRAPLYYKNQPVKAAGVLCYFVDSNNNIHLLLRRGKGGFADFGGKNEATDTAPIQIALREAGEESNQILSENYLIDRIDENINFYVPECKYLLYLAKIEKLDPKEFGEREIAMDEPHEVQWFAEDDKFQVHVRISHYKDYIKKIREIEHLL
ncbi:Conserved_hypothetical protein [Hexamita inflata]|uniref:Nudix hydrolase domain-containing protein n=1 Tax=Hexamita inflata TaxID=28002 RepID=A0AA86QG22_9EUKA|nr:Conserved hypothetical protein [Hexamita inflata]